MVDDADSSGALVACVLFVFHDGSATQRKSLTAAGAQLPPDALDLHIVDVVVDADDHAGRNRAIGRAKGSYIAVIDEGATPDPGWLTESIAVLRDDPTCGLVAVAVGGDAGDRRRIDPPSAAFVARRTMWSAVGGYDESATSARGLSLGWRCWLMGWRASVFDAHGVDVPVGTASPVDLERMAARLLRHPGSLREQRADSKLLQRRVGRRRMQRDRRRPDSEIGDLLTHAIARGTAAADLGTVLKRHGVDRLLGPRRSIVVVTADTLAPTMAGPAIRAWRVATMLADDHDVHLVTTGRCSLDEPRFPVEAVDHDRFTELVDAADIVIFQGWVMADRPWLAQSDVVIVADVYDPMHLEQLEHGRDAEAEGGRWSAVYGATEALNQQFSRGDYFLCASDKQRDLWLGHLASLGRVNQVTYDEDNGFHSRLRIVPFGIEDDEPVATTRGIRDSHPAIGPDDDVILWGGGIYNWFDPLTLISAVDRLRARLPSVRLYFLGTRHPNPEIPEMQMAVAARQLASDLDLVDSHVFFNDGWVPYDRRADFLLDADVAVSIHRAHIETEFSFRTRMLDYLWCGLPVVATSGDSFEPIIEQHELGAVVPPGDVGALEAALEGLLTDPDRRLRASENARRLAEQYRWSAVLEEVRDICRNPTRAPDVACPDTAGTLDIPERRPAWRDDVTLARRYMSEGGVSLVARRLQSRFNRRRSEND